MTLHHPSTESASKVIHFRWVPILLLNATAMGGAFAVTDSPKVQAPVSLNVLTIEDLANAQRQKLKTDLGKSEPSKANNSDSATIPTAKRESRNLFNPRAAGATIQTLVLMATYGTAGNPRAEVQFNGITRIVGPKSVLGATTVDDIQHGRIKVTLSQKQKITSYVLQPGERLDFEP